MIGGYFYRLLNSVLLIAILFTIVGHSMFFDNRIELLENDIDYNKDFLMNNKSILLQGGLLIGAANDIINDLKLEIDNINKYNKFKQALNNVEPSSYDKENYNCYDYTKNLQSELQEMGITSSIMVNQDRKHAWLAVWIEATQGKFIDKNNPIVKTNYNILELRDESLEVICE